MFYRVTYNRRHTQYALPSAMISYRCLRSVKLHHLSPQTNTLLLWTVNINTRADSEFPSVKPETSVHRQKITLLPKISQNKPIRSFILAPFFFLQSQLWRFTSYSEMYSYPIYVYTCFLWSRVPSLSPFSLIKDGTFLDFTRPVVPLCLARGFGWRLVFFFVPLST